MKHYLLTVIAVLTAIILALFTIETEYSISRHGYGCLGITGKRHIAFAGADVPVSKNVMTPVVEANDYLPLQGETARVVVCNEPVPPVKTRNFASLHHTAMMTLSPSEVPPLDAGMVNVTGGFDGNSQTAGYRVNPRPGEFAIAVPYDPSLLPQGFTEDDIQTYVYDRQYHRWVVLERDSVNEIELLVYSRFVRNPIRANNDFPLQTPNIVPSMDPEDIMSQTGEGGDSPLDFINAVLKTPEMPETSAYTPTSIKELKAADPLEGMTLMQPPTANNSGTANLSYPIEIPAGRQGMQPNLALTYSSGGGNGWLGVGWDISIPSITVETRWGVPRYDQDKESEVYVYEGEQLVTKDGNGNFRPMPHRTNQWTNRSTLGNEEQFFPRKNEVFDSIVRHGSGPDNYWWSVTHRNGVTDYYGKMHDSNAVDYNSVLYDPQNHNIAKWMLTESVDPSGNWVRYNYQKRQDKSVVNESANYGTQIYPMSVTYTGHDSAEARYSVVFNLKEGDRDDIITSSRYGFREVTATTLCNLEVLYKDSVLHRYYFVTENSRESGFKTRLTDMVRADYPYDILEASCVNILDSTWWSTVPFDPQHPQNQGFRHALTRYNFEYYNYPDENSLFLAPKPIQFDEDVDDEIISAFSNSGYSATDIGATALGATRGGGANGGGTVTVGVANFNLAITDFNVGGNFNYGQSYTEGLLTLIDLDGDGLSDKVFKKGGVVFYRPQIIDEADSLKFSFGDAVPVSGISDFLFEESHQPSFGVQGSIMAVVAASAGLPTTISTTSVYFTDINGDGLPDLVTDQGALFNSLDSNGHPVFTPVNSYRTDPDSGRVNLGQMIVTSTTTPCGGIIFDGVVDPDIDCDYQYIRDTAFFDGKPDTSSIVISLLADTTIIPIGFDDGMFFYFHIDGVSSHCGPVVTDPDLDAVRVWVAPYDEIITLTSSIRMIPDTSVGCRQSRYVDGIRYSVEKFNRCWVDTSMLLHSISASVLLKDSLDVVDTFPIDTSIRLRVSRNDILFFRIQSKRDRSYDNVEWNVDIRYDNLSGMDEYDKDRSLFLSYEDYVLTGQHTFQAPKSGTVSIEGHLTGDPGDNGGKLYITHGSQKDSLFIIANTYNNFPLDCEYQVNSGDTVKLEIKGNNGKNITWDNIECCPRLSFVEDPNDTSLSIPEKLSCRLPVHLDIQYKNDSDTLAALRKFFGPLYRGWGQFAYKNDSVSMDQPIELSSLILPSYLRNPTDTLDSTEIASALNYQQFHLDTMTCQNDMTVEALSNAIDDIFNPLSDNTRWVEMSPDLEHCCWSGFGNTTAIYRDRMSNTRPKIEIPVLNGDSYPNDITVTQVLPEYDHPVPTTTNDYPVQTVRKRNVSVMGNGSLSVIGGDDDPNSNSLALSLGGSVAVGANYVLSDYLDLNGDRYPDVLSKKSVQYTMPWGGIGNSQMLNPAHDELCNSRTQSGGVTFSGSYPIPRREAGGNTQKAKITIDGLGGNLIKSKDETTVMYLDINADGLPDRIYEDGEVALNTGYNFDPKESWETGIPRSGSSVSTSCNEGANFGLEQVSIGGGLGKNQSENITEYMLTDFNGDGLPDKVRRSEGGLSVNYNFGNGSWSPMDAIPGIAQIGQSHSYSENGNGALTIGFQVALFVKIQVGIQLSPYNSTFSRDNAQLTDINGDGYPDYVTSNSENEMTVRYNTAGKTNLLRKVTNFTGSTITLDYDMPLSCYEKPQRSWNLASVEVNDPSSPLPSARSLTRFSYAGPHYNRYERMDFGYATVITKHYDTDGGDSLYRYTVEEFENHIFTKRGRKIRDCIYGAAGKPYVEHLFDATVFDFAGTIVPEDSCSRSDIYVGEESDLTNYYEGQLMAKVTSRVVRKYDRYRNVRQYIHYGDTTHNREYFKAVIDYAKGMPHNMISLPVRIVVKDADSAVVQLRTASYTDSGKLRKLATYSSLTDSSVCNYTYDPFGNTDTCWLPENVNGERLTFAYQYDSVVHSFPVKVDNLSLGFSSTANYDFKFGKPTRTVDINGNEMLYFYDRVGRCSKILAPYENDSGQSYTIYMGYYPKNHIRLDIFTPDTTQSFAFTLHYDRQHPDNPIMITVLSDGLGRLLQTKKDAEIGGHEVSLVTGKVEYDCFGRTVTQYHPFQESTTRRAFYSSLCDTATRTTVQYDLLDRQTYVKTPLNLVTTMSYDFDTCYGKQCLRTTVTDPKGNKVKTLTGTLGQQLKQVAPMSTVTWFKYDCLGQLLQSIDPDTISTFYKYDMAGRMVRRVHPDAGTDRYHYDAMGNLTSHVNALADSIIYRYHYNQLTDVEFPRYPANNVHYQYGTASDTAINAVGKIKFQEDGSGFQTFKYGKLGELTENIRTFALPFESQTYTFKMQYEYDSWNRIQRMTYPDGEVVSYAYNKGGMLKSMTGEKNGVPYWYIYNIHYNEFELKEAVEYGNGTRAFYEYDTLQRLHHLRSESADGTMQDIFYTYNSVSNIIGITNGAGMLPNGLGGAYNNTYTYDGLYRLKISTGTWAGSSTLNYQATTKYRSNGRISEKNLAARQLLKANSDTVNYTHRYYYENTSQPNTLTMYSSSVWDPGSWLSLSNEDDSHFSWDATGNMTRSCIGGTLNCRDFCWDEQNRLQGVKDKRWLSYYQYDATGDRTYKLTGKGRLQNISGEWRFFYNLENATLYASPYLVATNKGYTKHYYAETERICSKIGGGMLSNLDRPIVGLEKFQEKKESTIEHFVRVIKDCSHTEYFDAQNPLYNLLNWCDSLQPETNCYWYHPDHLGSSSWITYTDGRAIQHLHYLPWGENFVDQRLNGYERARYTLSAKEKGSRFQLPE